ncbi:hypothetical protein [Croceicoccus mobilis]|uniref:Uncharacterized protein n=1 Tax=Croceicoccus mobilis TaxID=1703339 RepID=A0A916YUJ0_9SPHN|nr:hypothetical protein [Croceicoccus mobilis]GGD62307.1 hypothetical protein GCM10010990_09640 [Croceicoccus mobilis]
MGKFAIGLIALVFGLVIGGVSASMIVGGAAAGAGAGAGIMTGMCSTIQAAQNAGVMSAEDADRTIAQVASDLSDKDGASIEITGTAQECADFMAKYAS